MKTMSKCTNCEQEAVSQKSVIKHGKILKGCEHCINQLIQGNENARKYDRERMKRDHAKDLVQPTQPRDFIKAYGAEAAKEYYNEDLIRKFS